MPKKMLLATAALFLAWAIYMVAAGKMYVVKVGQRRATAAGEVKLTYVCWGDYTEEAMNRHWIAQFERQHPNLKVNIILTSGGVGTREKIQTMMAGGSAPDVMYTWPDVFPEFVEKGVYLPLDEYMARDGVHRAEWYRTLVDFYTKDDVVYGLPRSWHPFIIFYNKSLFDREGVPYPDETWTFDDLIRHGRKLTRDLNGDGLIDQYAIANIPWQVFAWAYGGRTFDEEGNCYLDDPATVRGLQLYQDLIWKYEISPSPQQQSLQQNAQDMFKTGRIAMFSLGIWCVPDFREIEGFEWDIAVMPAGDQRVTLLVTAGWSAYRHTPHPDEAWELIKYLSGREAQEYQMKIWRDPSGLKDVFQSLMFYQPEQPPSSRQVVLDSIKFGRFAAAYVGSAEVNTRVGEAFDEIATGRQRDVAAGCREMKRVAEQTLADLRAAQPMAAQP
ncbi:MAG: ABC transporter substrate-binding protein [Armatimonadota bacterium]